jgi:hypothetical protein
MKNELLRINLEEKLSSDLSEVINKWLK